MCDPATAAMIGVQAIGGAMQARSQNAQSARNRQAAIASMNLEQEQAARQHEEETRAAVEQAYELALEGRANEATFLNMAAEGGVAGISVLEGLYAVKNVGGRQKQRFVNEQSSRAAQTALNLKGVQAAAANRINSMPRASVFGGALTGALKGAGQAFAAGKFDKILKPGPTVPTGGGGKPDNFYEHPLRKR